MNSNTNSKNWKWKKRNQGNDPALAAFVAKRPAAVVNRGNPPILETQEGRGLGK
jgi:hypothetical protein